MKARLVLLGAPASGKGTQADLLHEHYGLPTASPGAMLREEYSAGTPLGLHANELTSQGLLVSDSLVLEVVCKWLQLHPQGFVFDGFPRTIGQATSIETFLSERSSGIEAVIYLEAELRTLENRVLNRLICKACGRTFGKLAAVHCPRCGGELGRRSDDTIETLRRRMGEYEEKTLPLVEFYEKRKLLHRVPEAAEPSMVFDSIRTILEGYDSD